MAETKRILFLISVPRSGSTVVQDHLAKNLEGAVTAPETWIIPFVMASRSPLAFSPVGLEAARMAENQFGAEAFNDHLFVGIESFLLSMIDAVPGASIFIEKTPRNVLYHAEISQFLPSATQILLVRHPIDIALSSFAYFCSGRPNLARVSIDLVQGVDYLTEIIRTGDGILVRYEDFIVERGKTLHCDLRTAGFTLCEKNSLYQGAVLRDRGMGDEKFKAATSLNTENMYRYRSASISLVTYIVLSALLKRRSYVYLVETIYGDCVEDVRRGLRRNINRLGVLDLVSFIGGGLSGLLNLKICVFKAKRSTIWKYLR